MAATFMALDGRSQDYVLAYQPLEQGHLLSLLVRLIGARRVLEAGKFTGCGALQADGHLVACDISEDWTTLGCRSGKPQGSPTRSN